MDLVKGLVNLAMFKEFVTPAFLKMLYPIIDEKTVPGRR